MEERNIPAENTPISRSLDVNIKNLLRFTENSSDIIVKNGFVCGNKIAVVTCEGMASTDTQIGRASCRERVCQYV